MFAIYIAKIFHEKNLLNKGKIILKMNTLFKSGAYWVRLQGTLIFEFHFYYTSLAQFSFYLLRF